jgi:uncharacterized protein (DUF1778 family)
MSRLTIEIDPEQHRRIKTLATYAGMTIKDFILAKTLPPAEGTDTTGKLLGSPANAERLRQALATPPSEHLTFESVEDVRHALGI